MVTTLERRTGIAMQPDMELARLGAMADDELDRELAQILEINAQNLLSLAMIIRVKEERGHDLSELKIGMVGYLRRIAFGQLLPEVVARYGAHSMLLRRVAGLPIPDQRRCVNSEEIKIAEWGDDKATHRLCRPEHMTPRDIRQVFASDHIRNVEEQIAYVRSAPANRRALPSPIEVDKKHGRIVVSGDKVQITREDLLLYLQRLG